MGILGVVCLSGKFSSSVSCVGDGTSSLFSVARQGSKFVTSDSWSSSTGAVAVAAAALLSS